MEMKREEYVFGLDIGTRSIVGTLGYRVGTDRFIVVAQVSIEHRTRAVIDGQIHDISTVAKTIAEVKARLEYMTGETLKDVSIEAAGRVIKKKNVYAEYEMPSEGKVTTGRNPSRTESTRATEPAPQPTAEKRREGSER